MNPQRGRELTEDSLSKEFTIKFNRRELTTIYNLILRGDYKLGDARLLIPIIEKIEGPVISLTDKDFKPIEKNEANNTPNGQNGDIVTN